MKGFLYSAVAVFSFAVFGAPAFACDSCGMENKTMSENPFSESSHADNAITIKSVTSFDTATIINDILKHTGIQVVDIDASKALPDFYKVYDGNSIYYIRKDMKYLVRGNVFDLETKIDITAKELISRSLINVQDFKSLSSVTIGSGPLEMYVFTDPDCPVCKVFEHEISGNMSKYTIHYLLRPLERLHPVAKAKSMSILCSDKPVDRFEALAVKQSEFVPSESDKKCKSKVNAIAKVADKYNINGTPTIVSKYGLMNRGALLGDDIDRFLKFDPSSLNNKE